MGRVGSKDGGVLAPAAPPGAELWIGSGRQHQVFVRRDPAGILRLSPQIWSTAGTRWLDMQLYQQGAPDLAVAGCLNCHLSFVSYSPTDRGITPGWSELPVGCEACHGPGLNHVRARRAGQADAYGGIEGLGAAEEARLCGRCHGNREDFREERVPGGTRAFHRTLTDRFLRPDGTQRLTGYQLGGHLMSQCHRVGKAQCRHCHDPHSGRPRALDGASAQGADSDRQCTACHRDRIARAAARKHAKHPAKELRCIECHMAPSWIGDTPERDQRTADHAISAPRLGESKEFGLPNACATCHEGRRGGMPEERRPWVSAVARGRLGRAEAAGPVMALLADPSSGDFGRASALELMAGFARTPQFAQAVIGGGWQRDPDPVVRGHALVALSVHSPDGAQAWIRLGLDDSHGTVRMRSFERAQTQMLTDRDLDQFLEDALSWRQRPRQTDFMRLAEVHLAKAQFARAVEVLGLAQRVASPDERVRPQFRALVDRAGRMASGGVGDRPWAN